MGGNALKHLNPVRLTTPQLVALYNHIGRCIAGYVERHYLVPWIDEKTDHGDIDIVVDANPDDLVDLLSQLPECGSGAALFVRNDNIISVPFTLNTAVGGVAQVDFICAERGAYRPACFFYSGGDFGMMLGRVAAWHGYVFGMDGLRLRADPKVPWMKDITVSDNPSEILRFLGYGQRLPWFDTYETMWEFILQSPLAHPSIFMPEATNGDNRSRDKQRPKIAAFQEWVKKNYSRDMSHTSPRVAFKDAYEKMCARFNKFYIDEELQRQSMEWEDDREYHRVLGIEAFRAVLITDITSDISLEMGQAIGDMQAFLPPKEERKKLWKNRDTHPLLIRQAIQAAFSVCCMRGWKTNTPREIFGEVQ